MNLVEVKEPSRLEPYVISDIEQMHDLEDLGGISIRGVSAEVETKGSKRIRYNVTVMGEILFRAAGGIKRSIGVYVALYDDAGRVCGSELIAFISEGACGGVALNRQVECKSPAVKLRIFPQIH